MTERQKADNCVICCKQSYQSVCAICNVKMHTECYIMYIAKSNDVCPQCKSFSIHPSRYQYSRHRADVITKIRNFLDDLDTYRAPNGHLYMHQKSISALSSMFKYIRENKDELASVKGFMLQVKIKLIDLIENEYINTQAYFCSIYTDIFKETPYCNALGNII